ncbi:hypothetical protein [Gillisia sp. Hel_I_29]|uniref:hypothetical protein n=1 Tax=Gillisia sp. Hel_I_29 TaxID=1249975 RepID=UPI0005555319|nr:hypothetical protein [Gillisia sp. Hel_I_29]
MNLATLTELQNDFNSALEKTINKNFLIENELREINNYLDYSPTPKIKRNGLVHLKKANQTQIFKLSISDMLRPLFNEAVHSFLTTGKFPISNSTIDTEESLNIKKHISKQAFEFSEYYKWLIELKNTPQKTSKKSTLTHKQKLLALHYLGLDLRRYDNIKSAKILEPIIGQNFGDTRKQIPFLYGNNDEVRNQDNLEKVLQLFDNAGFEEIADKIKEDIEKIK